mgnify:FL=1
MVLIEIAAAAAAVVLVFVLWRSWPKHQRASPPWGMREYHRRNKGPEETVRSDAPVDKPKDRERE